MAILNPYNYITVQDFKDSNIYDPILFDNVATPDSAIQLAIDIASRQINTMCGGSINTKWNNPPSPEWTNLIQLATLPYVRFLASKGVDWLRGSATFSEGGVASSQTNPEDPLWIPPETLGFLQQAGELINTYLVQLPTLAKDLINTQCIYSGMGYNNITWNEALNTFWRKGGVVSSDNSVSINYTSSYENNFITDIKVTPETIANAIINNPSLLTLISTNVLNNPNFITLLTTSTEFEQAITNVIENDAQLQALVEQAIVQYLETDPNFANAISQSVETLIANDPAFVTSIANALTSNEAFVTTISEYVLNRVNASFVNSKDSGWISVNTVQNPPYDVIIKLDKYSDNSPILDTDSLSIDIEVKSNNGYPVAFTGILNTNKIDLNNFKSSGFSGDGFYSNIPEGLMLNLFNNPNSNGIELRSATFIEYGASYKPPSNDNQTIQIKIIVTKISSVNGLNTDGTVFNESSIPLINNERAAIDLLDSNGTPLEIPKKTTYDNQSIIPSSTGTNYFATALTKLGTSRYIKFDDILQLENNVGNINNLITSDKSSVVNGINSLVTELNEVFENYVGQVPLTELTTNNKSSLVEAINEVNAKATFNLIPTNRDSSNDYVIPSLQASNNIISFEIDVVVQIDNNRKENYHLSGENYKQGVIYPCEFWHYFGGINVKRCRVELLNGILCYKENGTLKNNKIVSVEVRTNNQPSAIIKRTKNKLFGENKKENNGGN